MPNAKAGELFYKITVYFRAGQPGAQAELMQRLGADLRDAFAVRAQHVAGNMAPFSPPGVFNIDLLVGDKGLVWEVNRWVAERVRPHMPESFVTMDAPADGASIARARWVPLDSDWYNVERGKEYQSPANPHPVLCTTCGWPNFDVPPAPFFVDGCIASVGKNEFLPATNGVFVVSARVRDVLSSLVRSEFEFGPVVSRGKRPLPGEFCWIRPVRQIGAEVAQRAYGTPCTVCGMPEFSGKAGTSDGPPLAPIVEHFGDQAWNLALVGEIPLGDHPRDQERGVTRNVAVSGGLFAALWNHGIKGQKWPDKGPYVSRVPVEDTWEASRRFADLFPPARDKAAKYKPKR